MHNAEIAVIGGSGLYDMPDLVVTDEVMPETPFGPPSDRIVIGELAGHHVAFLPRHGRGHRLLPSEVPYRANIYALKSLGVRWIISVSACGSLREDYRPGDIVIPDGLLDRTRGRPLTFFGDGMVAHVGLADPFDAALSDALFEATEQTGARVHRGGNFVVIEGPRFSTKAESHLFRQWGMDIIGMTALPEASLAREAEIAYACMAHVTDYDVWHETEEAVSVEMVVRTLLQNVAIAQQAIRTVVTLLDGKSSPAWDALRDALMTDRGSVPDDTRARLWLFLKKYWS